jgi:hypothetical protein
MHRDPQADPAILAVRVYQLQYLSMFGGVDRSALGALLERVRWEEVQLGEAIAPALQQGEVGVVVCGALELPAGRDADTLRILGRGAVRVGGGHEPGGSMALRALTPVTLLRVSAAAGAALRAEGNEAWARIQACVDREEGAARATRAA